MDRFTQSYIETMYWSSTDDDGTPFDSEKYADTQLADETLARIVADCEKFQTENADNLAPFSAEDNGHNFWLTRNGHGAGFWDGDYPEPQATSLTEAAHQFGECDLYVGEDGKFYLG
jgi:hypothetical protein